MMFSLLNQQKTVQKREILNLHFVTKWSAAKNRRMREKLFIWLKYLLQSEQSAKSLITGEKNIHQQGGPLFD